MWVVHTSFIIWLNWILVYMYTLHYVALHYIIRYITSNSLYKHNIDTQWHTHTHMYVYTCIIVWILSLNTYLPTNHNKSFYCMSFLILWGNKNTEWLVCDIGYGTPLDLVFIAEGSYAQNGWFSGSEATLIVGLLYIIYTLRIMKET